jgi:glycine cleavage system H protein
MSIPSELLYTKDHEWARKRDDGAIVVGITHFAQDALGDVTYVELPEVGAEVRAGAPCGVIESVKTYSEIYAPCSGEILEVNGGIDGNEGVINESPYEDGWLFVIRPAEAGDLGKLLGASDYATLLAEQE